jgi:hypothetical protein
VGLCRTQLGALQPVGYLDAGELVRGWQDNDVEDRAASRLALDGGAQVHSVETQDLTTSPAGIDARVQGDRLSHGRDDETSPRDTRGGCGDLLAGTTHVELDEGMHRELAPGPCQPVEDRPTAGRHGP